MSLHKRGGEEQALKLIISLACLQVKNEPVTAICIKHTCMKALSVINK